MYLVPAVMNIIPKLIRKVNTMHLSILLFPGIILSYNFVRGSYVRVRLGENHDEDSLSSKTTHYNSRALQSDYFDCEDIDDKRNCEKLECCRWSKSEKECIVDIDGDFDCDDIDDEDDCESIKFCRWSDSKDDCVFDCDEVDNEPVCDSLNGCRWSDSRDDCVDD